MKRKGFTLVELLAVIVILAVIALIAVPMILGVIEKSRRGALQNSGYGLVEAGNLYNAQYQNVGTVRFDIKDNVVTTNEENKLIYKGNVKEGTVLINNKGEVTVCINDGKYAAYKNFSDNKVTIVDNKTCTIPENSNIVYLDSEPTINTNIEELVSRIESLENTVKEQSQKIEELENVKSNQTEIQNQITNLNNTHNVDMATVNNKLGTTDISSIGNGTITGSISKVSSSLNDLISRLYAYNHMTIVGYTSEGTTFSTEILTQGTYLCTISAYIGAGRRESTMGLYLVGVHTVDNAFQYREIISYPYLSNISLVNSKTVQFSFNTSRSHMASCMLLN